MGARLPRLLSLSGVTGFLLVLYVCFSVYTIGSLVFPARAGEGEVGYRAAVARLGAQSADGVALRFEVAAFVSAYQRPARAFNATRGAAWRGVVAVRGDGGVELDGEPYGEAVAAAGAAGGAGEGAGGAHVAVPSRARDRQPNASAAAPVWAHVFAAPLGKLPGELVAPKTGVDRRRATGLEVAKSFGGQYRRCRLSRARDVPTLERAPRNLLTGELAPWAANYTAVEDKHSRNHWVPELRVRFISEPHAFPQDELIPEVAHYALWNEHREWMPVLHLDEAWVTKGQLPLALNESTPTAPLNVSVGQIGLGRWRLYNLLEQGVGDQLKAMGGGDDELDEVKEMLVLANPKMLALSLLVSVLHMFFEFLAMQADMRWWSARKDKRSLAGISVRSVLMVAFCQVVVFLYVLEQKASTLVIAPMAVSLALEMWKVLRALRGMRFSWSGLKVAEEDAEEDESSGGSKEGEGDEQEEEETVTDKKTDAIIKKPKKAKIDHDTLVKLDESDAKAGWWLNALLYPIAAAYSIYTLVYGYHRGWYAWWIGSLYRVVFVMGFVALTPQLFMNAKLKSVASMPWEAMIYKFFNTFVDDLFAFLIPMPTLHRLACLRDDIIFFIFLYQRQIYSIDPDRPIQL